MIIDEQGNKWEGFNVQSEGEKVYDPEKGGDALIRTFSIVTDSSKDIDTQGIIEFHRKAILDILFRDGWELERELTIQPAEKPKGMYNIFAVCKPAVKHGSRIGLMNDETKNASRVLSDKK